MFFFPNFSQMRQNQHSLVGQYALCIQAGMTTVDSLALDLVEGELKALMLLDAVSQPAVSWPRGQLA